MHFSTVQMNCFPCDWLDLMTGYLSAVRLHMYTRKLLYESECESIKCKLIFPQRIASGICIQGG